MFRIYIFSGILFPALLIFPAIFAYDGLDLSQDFVDNEYVRSAPESEDNISEAFARFALIASKVFEGGKLEESDAQELVKILIADPEARTPLAILMSYRLGRNEAEKLLQDILPVLDKNPHVDSLALAASLAYARLEKKDEAISMIERTLKAIDSLQSYEYGKNYVELVSYLAELYVLREDFEKGEELFDKAFSKPALHDNFKLRRAAFLFFSKKAEERPFSIFSGWKERRFYRKMMENFSHIERLWMNEITPDEGGRQLRTVELAPIIEVCKKFSLIERIEDLIVEKLLEDPNNLEAKLVLAALFYDLGRYANSRRLWKIICSRVKDNFKFYSEYGRAAMMSGKHDEAIRALEWAEFISNPKDKENAQYMTGIAYFHAKNYEKALAKFAKLKSNPDAHYYRALCFRRLGDDNKAAEALDIAEKTALDSGREDFIDKGFYLYAAYVNDKAKRKDKAIEILKSLYKKYPDDHEVCNFLGYLLADYNMELALSREVLEKALKMEPDNAAYLDSMAWLLYREGNYNEALTYILKSIENLEKPEDPVVYDHAGDIFYALSRKEEAIKYWKIALEVYSEDTNRETIKKKIIEAGGKIEE